MKRVVFSPTAIARLREIARYSAENWGRQRAAAYRDQLIERIQAIAAGALPHPLPCARLFPDEPSLGDLHYVRAGAHYVILKSTPNELQIVDLIGFGQDLETLLRLLASPPAAIAPK